jgi:hypothetical protein
VLLSNVARLKRLPQLSLSSKLTTTGREIDEAARIFEVTHPFHPLCGKQFVLVTRRQTWGEDRINYFDQNGKLCSMLASWTNVADRDYFLQASDGRSWFRVDDLLNLSLSLQTLLTNQNRDVK